jgi:hypothetical protein
MPESTLTEDQLASWQETGFLVFPGLFPAAEAAAWRDECARLLALPLVDLDNRRTRFRRLAAGPPLCERFDPVVDVSPVFRSLADDPRLTGPVHALFREAPLLFKDKLIFKPPGMSGYQVHQDGSWWPGFPFQEMLSALIAIDSATRENGALEVFPGYHHALHSTPGEIRNLNGVEVHRLGLKAGILVEAKPGDVLLFHALTPHRSGQNSSDTWRRQLYLTYSPRSHGDLWPAHQEHLAAYVAASLPQDARERLFFR